MVFVFCKSRVGLSVCCECSTVGLVLKEFVVVELEQFKVAKVGFF